MSKILQGDCLELLPSIPDKSIDLIFSDLPYKITQNQWDIPIDLPKLWEQYNRIIKDHGVIALWAQAPFSHVLACSNLKMFRYEWVIEKTKATGHLNAKKMPMKAHENILIFYKKLPVYHPQMSKGHTPVHSYVKHTTDGTCYGQTKTGISGGGSTQRYPRDVLKFPWDTQKNSLHATQKPVAVCEYIIKTYTNPGDVVLDSTAGSMTTAIAAIQTGRKYICMEKNREIFETGKERIRSFLLENRKEANL